MFCYSAALANSCQLHPSEYAYPRDSVNEAESVDANCRRYPSGLQAGVFTQAYIHCDGTQVILTDSDLGSEQYSSSDYYVWPVRRDGQLLFIFPTRVYLTTITLHYYSDSVQGLSRLIFYAAPDDFNVWNALSTGTPHVDVTAVPPGGGCRNANHSINVTGVFSTKKVLMYIFSSSFTFVVSEVEFFTCEGE